MRDIWGCKFYVLDDIPEVLPDHFWHDGWNGAAGAELRDTRYEPYPHHWDETLRFCRGYFATYYHMFEELSSMDRPVERIPHWIIRRALPGLRRNR